MGVEGPPSHRNARQGLGEFDLPESFSVKSVDHRLWLVQPRKHESRHCLPLEGPLPNPPGTFDPNTV